ncbi:MAG: hypothetical protein RR716_05210 [Christensenellaceae bacterium]
MKSIESEPTEKSVSIATLLFGAYMIFSSIRFSTEVLQITGESAFPGIGILIVVMSFVLPVLLLLVGVCGMARKVKAGMVIAVIVIVMAAFSIIFNLTLGVFEWELLPAIALPVLFIGYTRMAQKRRSTQEEAQEV